MHFAASILSSLSLLLLSALTPLTVAAPTSIQARDSSEIYYLVNCFNNITFAAYAEIDWYADEDLSLAGQTPDETCLMSADDSIDYEDGTWRTTTPFTFTAVIYEDAYTAAAGSVIGTANASTSTAPLSCIKLTRVMLYEPGVDEQCYSDYACIDA